MTQMSRQKKSPPHGASFTAVNKGHVHCLHRNNMTLKKALL